MTSQPLTSSIRPNNAGCGSPRLHKGEQGDDQLDFDASGPFTGRESLHAAGETLRGRILAVASGELTWGEITREGDEVLSRFAQAL